MYSAIIFSWTIPRLACILFIKFPRNSLTQTQDHWESVEFTNRFSNVLSRKRVSKTWGEFSRSSDADSGAVEIVLLPNDPGSVWIVQGAEKTPVLITGPLQGGTASITLVFWSVWRSITIREDLTLAAVWCRYSIDWSPPIHGSKANCSCSDYHHHVLSWSWWEVGSKTADRGRRRFVTSFGKLFELNSWMNITLFRICSGLASAWAMARRRPKEYCRKMDAATRYSGVCPPHLTWICSIRPIFA